MGVQDIEALGPQDIGHPLRQPLPDRGARHGSRGQQRDGITDANHAIFLVGPSLIEWAQLAIRGSQSVAHGWRENAHVVSHPARGTGEMVNVLLNST
jgi:hypothetical protein